MHATLARLIESDFPVLKRRPLETLQVNLGYRCNQQCLHCHVNANPKRKENMMRETVEKIVELLDNLNIQNLDVTGGAPELNPNFRYLVEQARNRNIHVLDRCNLTILDEPDQSDLAEFLAHHRVEVVASLPCYTRDNVEAQRGEGVFAKSIAGLKKLNTLGYGKPDSGLRLNLVYNPGGAFLPPSQQALELDYKKTLLKDFAITFDQLFTLTNMPIKRFGSTLISNGEFDNYIALLKSAYLPDNLQGVMCLNLLSIDWQGYVYDCDFNQMLELNLEHHNKKLHIKDLHSVDINKLDILTADHCYGCTAGQGSSCGGALI